MRRRRFAPADGELIEDRVGASAVFERRSFTRGFTFGPGTPDEQYHQYSGHAGRHPIHIFALPESRAADEQRGTCMNHLIQVQGFEGRKIEIRSAGFFSDYALLIDGEPAARGPGRGQMILRRNDGTDMIATWKKVGLGLDVPQLQVGSQLIAAVKPLAWYQWVWSGLAVFLVFTGGAIGGMLGGLALAINVRIFHEALPEVMKYLAAAATSLIAFLFYLLIVFLIFGSPG